jgi:ribosomal protein S18 acetylase RimI-like enzyme
MLEISRARPKDIPYIADISESIFSSDTAIAPEGYDSFQWYFRTNETGYLYKILFNGSLVGGFVAFRTGRFNFQLERIFILPEFQNLGIGKKSIQYVSRRFPEARVWYADVKHQWADYSQFLIRCGFFESISSSKNNTRYIKLI